MLVTAIPGTAVLSTLEEIGEDVLGDRTVLDCSAALREVERHLSAGHLLVT